MKKVFLCLLLVSLLVPGAALAAGTVTFEDLYPGYEIYDYPVPAGYGGFNWSESFGWITKEYHPGSGYDLGCIGKVAGFTAYANPVWFEGIGGEDFVFIGAFITAAWDDTEDVIVKGYLNGSLIHEVTITTYNDAPYYFNFNWGRVDKVAFEPQGAHIAIDNINHCNPVPLPGTLLLLGSSLLGLVGLRLRKA